MKETIVEDNNTYVETNNTKKWEFRKINGKDLFLVLPILKRIGLNNIKKCFSGEIVKGIVADNKSEEYEKQVEAATYGAMLEFGQVLIEGLDNEGCEDAIYNLLEKTSNLSREEIENLSIVELPAMIIDFVKKDEFKDFLKVAQSYIK